jgi:hypothetical protein
MVALATIAIDAISAEVRATARVLLVIDLVEIS